MSSDSSAGRGAGSRGSRGLSGGGAAGGSSSASTGASSTAESRVERTNLDVRVDDIGAARLGFNGLGVTGGGRAGTTGGTGGTGLVGWVCAVEPEHVDRVVVPQTHDQDHTSFHSRAHVGQATVLGEGGRLAKSGELSSAEVGVDDISADSGDLGGRLGDDNAVLDVVTSNLRKGAGGGTVISDELSHNGEGLGGVDGLAGAVEVSVTETVRVEVTSVRVAGTSITIGAVGTTTVISSANS